MLRLLKSITCCFLLSALGALAYTQSEMGYTTYSRYDERGLLLGTISPSSSSGYLATRNTYDASGMLVKVENGSLVYFQNDTVKPVSWDMFTVFSRQEITYDHYGRKATVTTFDKNGTALSLTQTSYEGPRVQCQTVRMNRDVYASLPDACTLSPQGTYGPDRITRYTYDEREQPLTISKAVGTPLAQTYVTNTYDGSYLTSQTDANGNRTELRYDGNWRLERIIYPSPTTLGSANGLDYTHFEYDANGNKTVERKRNNTWIDYGIDANNRVIVKDYRDNTKQQDIYYDYDNRGLLIYSLFGSISGKGILTDFDGFGNVKLQYNFMFASGSPRVLYSKYDANNNRTSLTHPDGAAFNYTFDELDRVTGLSDPTANNMVTVNYQANGRRAKLIRNNYVPTTYSYQNGVQLSSFNQGFRETANNLTNSFLYNPASQITRRTYVGNPFYYTGNENRSGNYTVNGLNQYTYVGGPSQGTGQPFSYDTNGNLTNDGNQVYTYDDENRLLSTSGGGATSSFVYDPNGRLFQVTINGNTRQFLYDGDALVAEYNTAGTMLRRYVHGDQVDEPWVQYNSGNTYAYERIYLHADHQGSIIAQTDYSGGIWKTLAYDNFGIAASKNVDTFGYTGQLYFKELGLNYYKARIYNPKLGRFLQTDPIGYKDDMDLYSYAYNDPLNKTDPTGMSAEDDAKRAAEEAATKARQEARAETLRAAGMDDTSKPLADAAKSVADGASATGKAIEAVATPSPVAKIGAVGIIAANINRFFKKIPANAKDSVVTRPLPNGSTAVQASSPGKVPGSSAVYEKQIDSSGNTIQATKTTYDPQGNIVHVKDKITGEVHQ